MSPRMASLASLTLAALCALASGSAAAHPLGNFSINQFARIEPGAERVRIHYVADLAEIPAYQELARIDADGDGSASRAELDAYVQREATAYADALTLEVDGRPARLEVSGRSIARVEGAGGLSTLRIELDLDAAIGASGTARTLRFENNHLRGRAGWCEISLQAAEDVRIFDSNAYAGSASDELRAYPQERPSAPLDERSAELSFTLGPLPAGARDVATRGSRPAPQARDALAALIALPELGPLAIALALAAAFLLGATHALAPGHGKTIAAAYLVGARAHWRHAVYLALTVTLTHTAAVYALGFGTLGASRYFTPDQLLPVLSLISGAIVLGVGLALLARRLRSALGAHAHRGHRPHHPHHEHPHGHEHHAHEHHRHEHEHGHAHFPAGAGGASPGWRSWLAFGISGGLVPCPSALVVMLSAIALGRIAYGLVLVAVFSLGLATTLSAVGVLFVYAGRGLRDRRIPMLWTRLVPLASALAITGIGIALCWEALDGMKSLTGPFWHGG